MMTSKDIIEIVRLIQSLYSEHLATCTRKDCPTVESVERVVMILRSQRQRL